MKYKVLKEAALRELMEESGERKFEPYAELPTDYPDEYLPPQKDPESFSANDHEKNRRFVVEYRMKDGGITYGQIVAPSISAALHVYCDIEGRDETDIIAVVDTKQSKYKTVY